jgi:hypothetical protein
VRSDRIGSNILLEQRCLSADRMDIDGLDVSPARWSRFEYYAAHVRRLDLKVDGAYRSWSFLLPIKRLAATRPPTSTHPPPLLPNLTSITISLQYTHSLDQAVAVLTAPGTQLFGVEAFAGLLLVIPPRLQHANIVWIENTVLDKFTQSVHEYVRGLAIPASQRDLDLGLVGADYGFSNAPPGDYLTIVPRLASLESIKGFPLSAQLVNLLAEFPYLSEVSLYHLPSEVILPQADCEHEESNPQHPATPFPSLTRLRILSFHNMYGEACQILSHFPMQQLEHLELEFTEAYKAPLPHATHALFLLLGEHARTLRMFRLIVDAEKWDYSEPLWDPDNDAYALAPWSSLSCLLNCHELRSVVIKCAGAYHGCVLSPDDIRSLGRAWPYLSELCIAETSIGVDAVRQSVRPRVVDMTGLKELSRACPQLEVLKLTLDAEVRSVGDDALTNSRLLHLDLGYSLLSGDNPINVSRFVRQLPL